MTVNLGEPNNKQYLFMQSRTKYTAFGGARGGGKSWAVRTKAIGMCLRFKGIKVLIIRRTFNELRENHILPIKAVLSRYKGIAKYNDSKKEFTFFNGSRIKFGYCDSEGDLDQYQGTEADVIFIDEATQFSEDVFRVFSACVRAVNDYPKRIYLTCNPGGKGHGWVKRLFIDRHFKDAEKPEEYSFIQSLVTDNKALMESDPEYVDQLKSLAPKLREAWLYGNWNIFEGQFFEEFADDPAHYDDRLWTHVINPFEVPKHWQRFRSFDFGYSKPFSCGWWAQDEDGTLYRIAELYGCTETPDEGVKWTTDRIFKEIKRIEEEHPLLKGQDIKGVADPAIWQEAGGPSIADMAAKQGVYFAKGDHKRIPGWQQMHYRLAFDQNGRAMMYIFSTCKSFIRTLPLLVYSETIAEDLDTKQEDHIADETRYMCMLNPLPPRVTVKETAPVEDPLDLWKDAHKQNQYQIFME